jgi:(1->4)-alpha-D-glucan 1-alpha-D-glucosylmutase
VRKAKQKNRAMNVSIFYFLKDILIGHIDDRVSEEAQKQRRQFVLRLQQFTAPVMAKAVEDTVFYIYNRLVSLNEVGGQPDIIGTTLEAFHSANKERAEKWSTSLSASSTHDTKRSEDVRTRIHILSEIPGEWKRRLAIWSRLNHRFRSIVGETWAPDRNEEYLLYQILAGTWPTEFDDNEWTVYRERIMSYMQKAIKEAKINTSWVNPNELWEKAVSHFVFNILHHKHSERFIKDFTDFANRITHVGALHSLSQVILKIASPGICDIYQGTELWDDSLVDPDNRRQINFLNRDRLLQEIDNAMSMPGNERKALCRNWLENFKDGRIKLFFTSQSLRLRRQFPRLFRDSQYIGLTVEGEQKSHIVAFIRKNSCETLLVVTPRRIATMLDRMGTLVEEKTWGDTMIIVPNEFYNVSLINIFTGEKFMTHSYHGASIIWIREVFTSVPYVLAVDEQSLIGT